MGDAVLLIRHGRDIGPGHLGDVLAEAGIAVETVPLDAGAGLPGHIDYRAVVSLGGHMGAYDTNRFPWLLDEKRYLAELVRAGVPVLGICLGCQLLADALGGRAYKATTPEVALESIRLTAEGEADHVLRHLAGAVVTWHQDTWDPPPGGVVLAVSNGYRQAFRSGSALGIQPHPEVTPDMARSWAGRSPLVAKAGVDPGEFVSRIEAAAEHLRAQAHRMFAAWVETV